MEETPEERSLRELAERWEREADEAAEQLDREAEEAARRSDAREADETEDENGRLEEERRRLEEEVRRRATELARKRAMIEAHLKRQRRVKQALTFATASTAVVALLGSIIAWFELGHDQKNSEVNAIVHQADLNAMQARLTALQAQAKLAEQSTTDLKSALSQYQRALESGKSHSGLSLADHQELARVESSNSNLDKRLSALEEALSDSPEKALSVPLLRQQMVDAQEKSKGEAEALQADLSRLYGQMQWFFGLMITTTLSVTGLALNAFRQAAERKAKESRPSGG